MMPVFIRSVKHVMEIGGQLRIPNTLSRLATLEIGFAGFVSKCVGRIQRALKSYLMLSGPSFWQELTWPGYALFFSREEKGCT